MEGIKVVNTGINPVQKQTLETRSDFSGVNSVLPYPDKNDEQYPDYLSNIGKTLIQNFKHKTEKDKKIEQAKEAGFTDIISTSHYMEEYYETRIYRLRKHGTLHHLRNT